MCKTKKKRSLPQEPDQADIRNKSLKTVSAKGSARKQGTMCVICNKIIADHSTSHDGEDAVYCEGKCSAWMHRHCAGLSVPHFSQISSSDDPFLCVYCTLSNQASEIKDLKKLLQSLTADLTNLSKKVTNQETSTSSDGPVPFSNPAQVASSDIPTTVASLLAEEKEKDRRRLNLIVHQLIEPTESDVQKRKECDIKEASNIIQNYIGVSASITNAVRLGKKGAKPRLLKVSVGSRQEKASILKNCTKLRNKEHPNDIQKIYITPDLTPKEQLANKALRSQLDEMNKPDKLYKIKNGKIVRRED